MYSTWIFGLFIAAIVGFVLGWLLRQFIGQKKLAKADEIARNLIEGAKTEGEDLKRSQLFEAKEEIFQLKQDFERETKSKFNEIQRMEKQLSNRELNLDKKVDVLNKKEQDLNALSEQLTSKKGHLDKRERELEQLIEEENAKLERISGLSSEEAKRIQMQNLVETAKRETALEIQELRDQARQTAIREAKEIIIQAIQRSAIDQIVDTTVAVVNLPDDEMKGRIIGREGRNIRTFESATGIEVLIDDTPKTVVLSGFDPWRREIARQAMEKLIYDGRIHPGRIEEVVDKTRQEVKERTLEIGEQAVLDMGLHGLNLELVRLLGKQHFKTTYGQNLLVHSKEVSTLSGMMATQLGLDVRLAKRAGLLHDIGKVGEEYGETPSHEIGIELAKRYGENEIVQNAIAAQSPFDDVEITSPISIIVQAADAVSVSRPGAQKEMLENYLKRMRNLEHVATSFSGVERVFAIQAGKEIRVIVEHSIIEDTKAQILANDITKKIKNEVEYPGQVKVTVIREYRSVDYAT